MQHLCHALPKVELHAHLGGSARLSTIAELAPADVDQRVFRQGERSLGECFALFAAVHKTVSTPAALARVTREVLDDFAADNVKYLELRTTPRAMGGVSSEGYVRTVLETFAAFERAQAEVAWPMAPRLLLSVDRTQPLSAALETVALARTLRAEAEAGGARQYVVGIDFSGNPTLGTFSDFAPAFVAARQAGLPSAIHCAEVSHRADAGANQADTDAILRFRPERLGHVVCATQQQVAALDEARIPIEICPSSNAKTLRLSSLDQHPTLARWLSTGYPISINTDDTLIFNTSASRELQMVADTFGLTPTQVVALSAAPLEHAFLDEGMRRDLRGRFASAAAAAVAAQPEGEK